VTNYESLGMARVRVQEAKEEPPKWPENRKASSAERAAGVFGGAAVSGLALTGPRGGLGPPSPLSEGSARSLACSSPTRPSTDSNGGGPGGRCVPSAAVDAGLSQVAGQRVARRVAARPHDGEHPLDRAVSVAVVRVAASLAHPVVATCGARSAGRAAKVRGRETTRPSGN
jgi:hypothetical protein